MQTFASKQDAGLNQLFVVLAHVGEKLLAWHDPASLFLVGLTTDRADRG
jgi:hypothetical protein